MPSYGRRQVVRANGALPEDDATYSELYLSVGVEEDMVHDVTFRELLRDLHSRFPKVRLEGAYLGDLRILIIADEFGLVDVEDPKGAQAMLYREVLSSRSFGVPARLPREPLSSSSARMCLREIAKNPAFPGSDLIQRLLRFEPDPDGKEGFLGQLYQALARARTSECQAAFEAAAITGDVARLRAAFRAVRRWPELSTDLAARALLHFGPEDPRAKVVIDECSLDTLRDLEQHADPAVVAALSMYQREREADRALLASSPRPVLPSGIAQWPEPVPLEAPPATSGKLSKAETEALRKQVPKRIVASAAASYLPHFASQSRSKKALDELLQALVIGLSEVDSPAVDQQLQTVLHSGPIGAKRAIARQVHKRAFLRAELPELLAKLVKSSNPEDAELLQVFKEELYAEARRNPRPAWLEGASPELLRVFSDR